MTSREWIWARINQPIVIWALSTVVVGLFGTAYSEYISRLTEEREQEQIVERLKRQSAIRLEFAAELAKGPSNGRTLLDTLLVDMPETRIDKDFEGRSTLAILLELNKICGYCGTSVENQVKAKALISDATIFRLELRRKTEPVDEETIARRARSTIEQLLKL